MPKLLAGSKSDGVRSLGMGRTVRKADESHGPLLPKFSTITVTDKSNRWAWIYTLVAALSVGTTDVGENF